MFRSTVPRIASCLHDCGESPLERRRQAVGLTAPIQRASVVSQRRDSCQISCTFSHSALACYRVCRVRWYRGVRGQPHAAHQVGVARIGAKRIHDKTCLQTRRCVSRSLYAILSHLKAGSLSPKSVIKKRDIVRRTVPGLAVRYRDFDGLPTRAIPAPGPITRKFIETTSSRSRLRTFTLRYTSRSYSLHSISPAVSPVNNAGKHNRFSFPRKDWRDPLTHLGRRHIHQSALVSIMKHLTLDSHNNRNQ
jgi:hypothetical protein